MDLNKPLGRLDVPLELRIKLAELGCESIEEASQKLIGLEESKALGPHEASAIRSAIKVVEDTPEQSEDFATVLPPESIVPESSRFTVPSGVPAWAMNVRWKRRQRRYISIHTTKGNVFDRFESYDKKNRSYIFRKGDCLLKVERKYVIQRAI